MVNLALDGLEGEDSKIIDDDEDLYASLGAYSYGSASLLSSLQAH